MTSAELKINEFTEALSGSSPTPGGGSAAALAGALGAALTSMVASLTTGREKYREHEELMREILKETKELREALLISIDRDIEAFNGVSAVYKMPKETVDEKEARKQAMQNALKDAAKAPYHMMELALKGLSITDKAVGKSNVNAASDLGVAALTLSACARSAWLNVLINLSSIKDQAFVDEYRSKGEDIIARAIPLAEKIYDEIAASV